MNTKSIMITEQTNPAAMVAASAIKRLPEEAEAEIEAIKARARAEAEEVDERYKVRHRAAWNALESALDLNPDDNHSLCTDHLNQHGVVFVTVEEHIPAEDRGIGGKLGEMLAQALGGRLTSVNGLNGGVIEIDEDTLRRAAG